MIDDRLVWIDTETTGLDPKGDELLEIACIVTTGELKPVDEGVSLVIRPKSFAVLDRMSTYVWEMHTASGLLLELHEARGLSFAEHYVREYLRKHLVVVEGTEPIAVPLAGSSVHFDRAMLAQHMPHIESALHYRNVDVSTVKELVRRWNPAAAAALPPSRGIHRAMPDLQDSIAELRYYRAAGLSAA